MTAHHKRTVRTMSIFMSGLPSEEQRTVQQLPGKISGSNPFPYKGKGLGWADLCPVGAYLPNTKFMTGSFPTLHASPTDLIPLSLFL